MDIETLIVQIAVLAPGILFSLAFHECAHGYMAHRLGDDTAKSQGRLTLNPIAHIDPVGTIIVPAILLLAFGVMFGWAKPVPVDYRNLKNPKRDGLWVALAGPASNILLAVAIALGLHAYAMARGPVDPGLVSVKESLILGAFTSYVMLNLALAFFNLIPIQPLDGSKILFGLLPTETAVKVDRFSTRYGTIILLVLFFSGAIWYILWPPIRFMARLLLGGL